MFGRSGSIQLARVFGIRIGVDVSWFLVLFFFIFILSGSFRDTLNSSDTVAYLTAVASALLFFASLVLHELGHALAARSAGDRDHRHRPVVLRRHREDVAATPRRPGGEFQVAVAGPVVTLMVIALCVGIGSSVAGWSDLLRRRDAATAAAT